MICIFNFPYPLTYPYFICFFCNRNDAKQRVFLGKRLVALKTSGCVVC